MQTQRLAVGTSEGAIVMYDLRTATRLYVLECHKMRTTACSFSPDGRRLVTVSLEESMALVWKVGSSFTSFFHPGAPPRQGHSGSEPFKKISFNVGDQCAIFVLVLTLCSDSPILANTSIQTTFDQVNFEWISDRSIKIKIDDCVLTFST